MATIEPPVPDFLNSKRTSPPISIPIMERPSSALARGVKITEFHVQRDVNPEPVMPEEAEYLLEEYLSPRKLKLLTGMEDLSDVKYLEMKVDTRDTSLGNFGSHLPNLTQLKLSNSIISQARDLGTSLNNLRVLWMAQCGLEDIDGLASLQSLQELYLAYNEIADISPCSMLEKLQILDLEGNAISDIAQVEFLALCQKLKNLTLEGNPICTTPSVDAATTSYNYRRAVKKIIPHLLLLDDEPLAEVVVEEKNSGYAFESDWSLINEFYADGTIMDRDEVLEDELLPAVRPGTSSIRPLTGYRPGSALKPYTATLKSGSRPGTGLRPRPATGRRAPSSAGGSSTGSRPGSASRPGTAAMYSSSEDIMDPENDASELTQGGVVCGNISKALRARSSQGRAAANKHALMMMAKNKFKPEHSYDDVIDDDETMKDLISELAQWKSEYHLKRDAIDKTKAPQVLTIDHDDAIDLSGDEEEFVVSDEEEEDVRCEMASESHSRLSELATPPPDSGISMDQSIDHKVTTGNRKERVRRLSDNTTRRRLRLQHDESYDLQSYDSQTSVSYSQERQEYNPSPPSTPPSGMVYTSAKGKSASVNALRAPGPFRLRSGEVDTRPLSGPENIGPPRTKFRLNPVVDKTKPKVIDSSNPIVRTSLNSPERLVHDGPRALTSKAALGQPGTVPAKSALGQPPAMMKIRKGQLANVALLPSKPVSYSSTSQGVGGK